MTFLGCLRKFVFQAHKNCDKELHRGKAKMKHLKSIGALLFLIALVSCSDNAAYETQNSSADAGLPVFALPAPQPSAKVTLPRLLFGNAQSLGDINARLTGELDRQGYSGRSYFSTPNGFALATQIERIDAQGRPAANDRRWMTQPAALIDPARRFSFRAIMEALRSADPGRYRLIVFLVTTAARTTGTEPMSFEDAGNVMAEGGDYLPRQLAAQPLTADHNVTALVYEFARRSVSSPPEFVDPSRQNGSAHLAAAGLLSQGSQR